MFLDLLFLKWNTFQDRLIPEIRRQNIKSIPKANDYIWNHYIPDHNKRFGVLATDPIPAWKSLDSFTKANLENKFYMQEFRKILSGELISLGGRRYIIEHEFEHSLEVACRN